MTVVNVDYIWLPDRREFGDHPGEEREPLRVVAISFLGLRVVVYAAAIKRGPLVDEVDPHSGLWLRHLQRHLDALPAVLHFDGADALETELATAQADVVTEEGKASPDTEKITALTATITDLETQITEAKAAAEAAVESAAEDTTEAEDTPEDTTESAATDDTTANDMNV